MAKTKAQKEALLAQLEEFLTGKAIVLTEYRGMTVRDISDLRDKLRDSGSTYTVTKNTLLRKALRDAKIDIPAEILDVQLAVATSDTDEVEPNKAVVEFAKANDHLVIHGAIIDGTFVDEAGVRALAALPSREELYAKVVGSIGAPLSGLINVMGGNLRGLVNVLKQYQEKQSA